MDSRITQLKAQGPSRTCNESKEEEEHAPLKMPKSGTQMAELMITPPKTAYTVTRKLSTQYPPTNPITCAPLTKHQHVPLAPPHHTSPPDRAHAEQFGIVPPGALSLSVSAKPPRSRREAAMYPAGPPDSPLHPEPRKLQGTTPETPGGQQAAQPLVGKGSTESLSRCARKAAWGGVTANKRMMAWYRYSQKRCASMSACIPPMLSASLIFLRTGKILNLVYEFGDPDPYIQLKSDSEIPAVVSQ